MDVAGCIGDKNDTVRSSLEVAIPRRMESIRPMLNDCHRAGQRRRISLACEFEAGNRGADADGRIPPGSKVTMSTTRANAAAKFVPGHPDILSVIGSTHQHDDGARPCLRWHKRSTPRRHAKILDHVDREILSGLDGTDSCGSCHHASSPPAFLGYEQICVHTDAPGNWPTALTCTDDERFAGAGLCGIAP